MEIHEWLIPQLGGLFDYIELDERFQLTQLEIDNEDRQRVLITNQELRKIIEYIDDIEITPHLLSQKHRNLRIIITVNNKKEKALIKEHISTFIQSLSSEQAITLFAIKVIDFILTNDLVYSPEVLKEIKKPSPSDISKKYFDNRLQFVIPTYLIDTTLGTIGFIQEGKEFGSEETELADCDYILISITFPGKNNKSRGITLFPVSQKAYDIQFNEHSKNVYEHFDKFTYMNQSEYDFYLNKYNFVERKIF
jgi:PHP family Zn ribbon phosphoesterase